MLTCPLPAAIPFTACGNFCDWHGAAQFIVEIMQQQRQLASAARQMFKRQSTKSCNPGCAAVAGRLLFAPSRNGYPSSSGSDLERGTGGNAVPPAAPESSFARMRDIFRHRKNNLETKHGCLVRCPSRKMAPTFLGSQTWPQKSLMCCRLGKSAQRVIHRVTSADNAAHLRHELTSCTSESDRREQRLVS